MWKKSRMVFALVLACMVVLNLMPVEARAHKLDGDAVTLKPVSATYINPHYADKVTAADLNAPLCVAPMSDVKYYTDVEAAGQVLRNGMKDRVSGITLGFVTATFSDGYIRDLMRQIADAAVVHTGVSTEGDYLAWQYGGWKCTANGSRRGANYYVTLSYTLTYYTDAAQEAEMDVAVSSLLADLNPEGLDYRKFWTIYEWTCNNVTYDNANLNDDRYKLKHTAYAALINGTSVCQGYAVLLYRLALELGIDCRVITGDSNGDGVTDHAWNIVKIDGRYYNLDATWDSNYAKYHIYPYFLVTDQDFPGHNRDSVYSTEAFYRSYPMGKTNYGDFPSIMADSKVEASITAVGETVHFKYTPRHTENYTFYATGDYDTHGYVCDSEMNLIACDDNNYSKNFSITYTLEAGIPYILGARFSSSDKIGAFGVILQANHVYESVLTTPPSCTASGVMTYTCNMCSKSYTETVPFVSHDFVDATCIAPATCRMCGTTDGTALGHDYSIEWCKGENGHWHACSACNDKLDFAAHDFGSAGDRCFTCDYVRDHVHGLALVPAVEATCTEDGCMAYYTCSGCENWFEDASGSALIADKASVVIPAPGHDYVDADCAAPPDLQGLWCDGRQGAGP